MKTYELTVSVEEIGHLSPSRKTYMFKHFQEVRDGLTVAGNIYFTIPKAERDLVLPETLKMGESIAAAILREKALKTEDKGQLKAA